MQTTNRDIKLSKIERAASQVVEARRKWLVAEAYYNFAIIQRGLDDAAQGKVSKVDINAL